MRFRRSVGGEALSLTRAHHTEGRRRPKVVHKPRRETQANGFPRSRRHRPPTSRVVHARGAAVLRADLEKAERLRPGQTQREDEEPAGNLEARWSLSFSSHSEEPRRGHVSAAAHEKRSRTRTDTNSLVLALTEARTE